MSSGSICSLLKLSLTVFSMYQHGVSTNSRGALERERVRPNGFCFPAAGQRMFIILRTHPILLVEDQLILNDGETLSLIQKPGLPQPALQQLRLSRPSSCKQSIPHHPEVLRPNACDVHVQMFGSRKGSFIQLSFKCAGQS